MIKQSNKKRKKQINVEKLEENFYEKRLQKYSNLGNKNEEEKADLNRIKLEQNLNLFLYFNFEEYH